MERLPEEILLKVLSYLDTDDLSNLKAGCQRFYNLVYSNSKRRPKKKAISMIVAAKIYSNGKRAVRVICGKPGQHKILITDTQIIAEEPYYFESPESKEKILQKKTHKVEYENHLVFLDSFSRNICNGSQFDSENPLPSIPLENSFQETLLFFLRRFNLDMFALEEDDRVFTSDEMEIILTVIKATGPNVRWMRRMTETLDDRYLELIKELKCHNLMFCSFYDNPREKKIDKYSVENRILQIPCSQLFIYEPGLVSVSTMLRLLNEWKCGSREIDKYTYRCDQEGIDWFHLVKNDFKVIEQPKHLNYVCDATIFTIARVIDGKELQFHYYRSYLELHKAPTNACLPAVIPDRNSWDEEMEDLGFGIFD